MLVRWREDFIIEYVGIIINLHRSGFMRLWMGGKVVTLLVVCSILCLGSCERKANEQYNKNENACLRQCDEKGYFKEVCTRMCQSLPCYH